MAGDQGYQWSRPGCFKCKEPIGNRDYIVVKWLGKTWDYAVNVCERCWEPAGDVLGLPAAGAPGSGDPTHGRNVAV